MARASDPVVARREAAEVVRVLRGAGHVAYFAGGCVRDELLGLSPTDYDVATDARPEQVRAVFRRVHEVGAAFGVMLIPRGSATIEVATFRTEGAYSDRRRPDSVAFASEREDAARRDFTINALYLDPLAPPSPPPGAGLPPVQGALIDHVGGVADLSAGVIRAVGDPDQRLAEDHLRALRAVRFAARLGFRIEAGTASAITRHAAELAGVSRERIGEELRRMLTHPARGAAVGLLGGLGLVAPVLGENRPPVEVGAGSEAGWLVGGLGAEAPFATALAAWALERHGAARSPITDEQAERTVRWWRKAMCLSNHERDDLADVLRAHRVLLTDWGGLGVAARKRAFGRMAYRAALRLIECQKLDVCAAIRADLDAIGVDLAKQPPAPWVTGDDLIRLGMKPGPAFKRILHAVYDAQLDGTAEHREAALELAARLGV